MNPFFIVKKWRGESCASSELKSDYMENSSLNLEKIKYLS